MIVEIRGTNSLNKGALMMLLVALQETRGWGVDKYVVAPSRAFPYGDRNRYGLYQKLWFERRGLQKSGYALDFLLPQFFKDAYGLVGDKDVDVVLDASGFAYSDQWGTFYPQFTAKSSRRWKNRGCKFILLPQAFGPFQNANVARPMREVFGNAAAIYARDRQSLNYVKSIYGGDVKMAPDFTNLLDPRVGEPELLVAPVAIVPNARMIDKRKSEGKGYMEFLSELASGLGPEESFFLIHEGNDDLRIAEKVNEMISKPLKIVKHEDPLVLKWILSQCKMVVGSRFHALISSLSQGVPTFACGWSHKYEELFQDYQVPQCLVNLENGKESARGIVSQYENGQLHEISGALSRTKVEMKAKSRRLWDEVTSIVTG